MPRARKAFAAGLVIDTTSCQFRFAMRPASSPPQASAGPVVPRRALLGVAIGCSTVASAASLVPLSRFLLAQPPPPVEPMVWRPVCRDQSLAPGQSMIVDAERGPIIVLRRADASVGAFAASCPHLGCAIHHEPSSGQLVCPCHGARFNDRSGAVLAGPSPAPLKALPWRMDDGWIVVRL